jgi:hypothetical protein
MKIFIILQCVYLSYAANIEPIRRQQIQPLASSLIILTRDGRAITCSAEVPCPPGNTCRYSTLIRGIKHCYAGILGEYIKERKLILNIKYDNNNLI